MRMVRPALHRLPRAAILGLAVFLVAGAAFGAANAATGAGKQGTGLPPVFVVEEPRVGDRGTYALTPLSNWVGEAPSSGAFTVLEFEWREAGSVVDADGARRPADLLQVRAKGYNMGLALLASGGIDGPDGYGGSDYGSTYDLSDQDPWTEREEGFWVAQAPIARVTSTSENETVGFGYGAGTPLAPGAQTRNVTTLEYNPPAVPCPILWPWQGMALVTNQTYDAGACWIADSLLAYGKLRAQAVEQVRGVQAIRFSDGAFSVWMAPGIPYPVRLLYTGPDGFGDRMAGPRQALLELTAFERGTHPRAAGPLGTAPAWDLEPLGPWGLDDTGLDHPYPLSRAIEDARTDAWEPDVGDWLDAHPDAYAAASTFEEQLATGSHDQRWTFTLTDGDSNLGVEVHRSTPTGLEGMGLWSVSVATFHDDADYLPRAALPAAMPTVQTLEARWRDLAGMPALTYTLDADCPSDGCEVAEPGFRVGRTWASTTAPYGMGTGDWVGEAGSLVLDGQGRAQAFALVTSQAADPAVAPAGRNVADGARPLSGLQAGTLWWPSAEQATGAGLLAVAAGLAYWLWPALKAGPVALFARPMAEHPSRRLLTQLVEANPGIHFAELSRRSGLPNGTLVHHLRALVREEELVVRPSGGYSCYFRPGVRDPGAAVLKAQGARRILAEVRAVPGLSGIELAARTGLQPSTVAYHAQRLADAGLVTQVRDGRAVRLHPSAA